MLDGLDELGLTRQKKCIDKINEFLESNSSLLQLVICCREEEYQQGEAILNQLRGAVCLQPLSEKQIQNYLRELKCQHLWEGIKNDADGLGELEKTPLFLNLIPVTYPDGLMGRGERFNSEDEKKDYQDKCRKELFDKYIEKRLGEYHDRKGYKVEDVKRWLVWLAKTMKEHKLKEFYIEKMQPSYLDNRKQIILYSLIVGLIYGLFIGLFIEIIYGLIFGLILGLVLGIYCVISELFTSKLFTSKIETVETLKLGFSIKSFLAYGLTSGLISGLIYGLIIGLIYGLIIGLIYGLHGIELINKTDANQGIKESANNTFIFTLIALPLTILLYFLLLYIQNASINILNLVQFGLRDSLIFGIAFAGTPRIQHLSLRLILWKNGSIPWNYARFLKYADERKLINQVSGRFTFIHDKLQEHFARM